MRLTSCRFAARSLIPSLPVATHLTVQPAAARQGEQLFCAPQRPETPQFPHKHVCTATSPPSPSSVRRATLRFGVGSLAAVPLAQVLVFTMHESSRTGAQRRPYLMPVQRHSTAQAVAACLARSRTWRRFDPCNALLVSMGKTRIWCYRGGHGTVSGSRDVANG